jgi:hypothetical protein
LQLLDGIFSECRRYGELLVAEGCITREDIEEAKLGKIGRGVLGVGLPAYVILKVLIRSAKANSSGLILSKSYIVLCACHFLCLNLFTM